MKFWKLHNHTGKIFLGIAAAVMLVALATPVLARDPAPMIPCAGEPGCPTEGPNAGMRNIDYFTQVFNPAINSQDVNLQSTVYEIVLSLLSSLHKINFKCDEECLNDITPGFGSTDGKPLANGPTGLIPALGQATAGILSTTPVSGHEYLASVGKKLNIVSPVYAQGFGYEGLRPGLPIWTAFRNIAYLLAAIGFVVLSFMIMLRLKISAQTVIGAQQALTKLIIVFLAVTFSYAIAGFIVDLIFVLSFVIIALFAGTGLVGGDPVAIQTELFTGNILGQLGPMVTLSVQAGLQLNRIIVGLLTDTLGGALSNLFGVGFGVVGALIIGIAVVYAMLRLLFMLLMTYLEILVLTIMGPILILPDILPGGGAFMGWMKRLFANAMVWPTVTFMLLLGRAIVGIPVGSTTPGSSQFLTGLQLPYMTLPADALQPFLGVGAILMTYQAAKMVKDTLKISAFQYSSAIGAALAFGAAKGAPIYNPTMWPGAVGSAAQSVPFVGGYAKAEMMRAQRQQKLYQRDLERGGAAAIGTSPNKPSLKTRFWSGLGGKKS